MTVRSRAYRTLRSLNHYEDLAEKEPLSKIALGEIDLEENEKLIGVYRNPGSSDTNIAVTELGLRAKEADGWSFIRFDDIEEATAHPPDKHEADSILLLLRSGEEVAVPVKGKNGRFRDVFEFLRFLDRVKEDRK